MINEPQRRDRLRLARQRPAPNHVRARVREERPEPQPEAGASWVRRAWRRLRRAHWAHAITVTGTALAAVAAIGGLWAQAVASYWSQQTAKDQLSQSKEDAARQTQDQASKVTYWVEHPLGRRENMKLHVLNRSPDPVSGVRIVLDVFHGSVAFDGDGHVSEGEKPQQWELLLTNLGPCAEIVYPAPKMRLETIPRNHIASLDEWPKLSDQGHWKVGSMQFIDSSGRGWTRTSTGLDKRSSPTVDGDMNIIWFNDEETHEADLCEGSSR
ncbi:hypothetical protein ABT063_47260 [Streptomyces sp. NPDC002838]|uniref:hypothetical protein n=1 Tax=Streptomyces sp. NPDC002838 TaxID=3154436 RepID=UPI003326D76E